MKGLRSNETSGNIINGGTLSLDWQHLDCTRLHWFAGSRTRKEGVCGGLDSCLTLSTLLMGPKLDSHKLRHCLSKYFFVGSSLTTNIMSQSYLKIGHWDIENVRYDYQHLCTRCRWQGETPGKVSFTLMHSLWTWVYEHFDWGYISSTAIWTTLHNTNYRWTPE